MSQLENIRISKCSACGWEKSYDNGIHNYLADVDNSDEVNRDYIDNYETLAQDNLLCSNLDSRYIKHQAKNIADYVPSLDDKKICDLGFGQGYLTQELIKRGANCITAVDLSPSYLARFSNVDGVTTVLANAERLPFYDEFDVLFSTDVMEHVLNMGSFLISVNRAMKNDGVVCIRVPYREDLLAYSPAVGCKYNFVHLRGFNKDLLRIYMKKAGFKVEKIGLDGFSLGTPQEWFMKNRLMQSFYNRVSNYVRNNVDDETSVTRWNSLLARLFMRPAEIVVVAKKVKNISFLKGGGYTYE